MNTEKLIDILIIFAQNKQELGSLRINKLLYFVDKYHLRKYGRFVIDDKYYKFRLGPVATSSYSLISDFFEPFPFTIKGKAVPPSPLAEYFCKEIKGKYSFLKLKKERDPDYLSESEKEAVQKVLEQYGKISTSRLVDITHNEKTWTATSTPSEIEMDLFLDGMTSNKKELILGLINIDKENQCVVKSLNR